MASEPVHLVLHIEHVSSLLHWLFFVSHLLLFVFNFFFELDLRCCPLRRWRSSPPLLLFFNPLYLGFFTKIFRVTGLEPFLSCELNSPAILESLFLFAATVRVDCVPIDGAHVGDWVHITRGPSGGQSRGEESAVDCDLRLGQTRRGRMARAVMLWACMGTVRLYEEMARLGVRDDSVILGSEVAGKHRVTIFVAISMIS